MNCGVPRSDSWPQSSSNGFTTVEQRKRDLCVFLLTSKKNKGQDTWGAGGLILWFQLASIETVFPRSKTRQVTGQPRLAGMSLILVVKFQASPYPTHLTGRTKSSSVFGEDRRSLKRTDLDCQRNELYYTSRSPLTGMPVRMFNKPQHDASDVVFLYLARIFPCKEHTVASQTPREKEKKRLEIETTALHRHSIAQRLDCHAHIGQRIPRNSRYIGFGSRVPAGGPAAALSYE